MSRNKQQLSIDEGMSMYRVSVDDNSDLQLNNLQIDVMMKLFTNKAIIIDRDRDIYSKEPMVIMFTGEKNQFFSKWLVCDPVLISELVKLLHRKNVDHVMDINDYINNPAKLKDFEGMIQMKVEDSKGTEQILRCFVTNYYKP